MKDKRLLYLLGAGTLTGLAGTAGAQQQRPNIIYMMADQLRADVLGYAGDGLAVTPNIDRFARQSLDRSVEIVRVWFRFALGVL